MTARRLLNPGPVTLSPRVRAALGRPDLCHRQEEYGEIQAEIRQALAGLYCDPADWSAVLLAGSGTAAVEAMLGSLVPRDGRTLVIANGVYGERAAAILAAQGKPHHLVRAEWTAAVDPAAVERALGEEGYSHAVAVHHETTTGRLNDLAPIGELCRRHGAALLVDAVSSFGGERIDLQGWSAEACAATANKCLHGAPGVSFVVARRAALGRPTAAPGVYLDLQRHHAEQERGTVAFTPAVHPTFALQEALREHADEGGWRARRTRHRALSSIVRTGLLGLGFELLLEDESAYGASLTSFRLPAGVGFERLYGDLLARDFVIYPGQRALAREIFRVAVMGDLDPADAGAAVAAFAGSLAAQAGEARHAAV